MFRRTVTEPIKYGYAVGRVRVLEGRMLPPATYERLLDAPTFGEQKRVLSDSPYGRFLEDATTVEDVERGLDRALDELYDFLVTANLPKPVIRFFRVRYDYTNLEARLKSELLGVALEGMLVPLGTVPVEAFKGPVSQLPKFLRELYVALSDSEEEVDEERISATVDRALYADLLACANASKSRFLAGLAALMVDVGNVRTLLRARARSRKATEVGAMLLAGGSIEPERLMAVYALPVEEIAQALASEPPFRRISADEIADLARFDVLADDMVVRYLRQARMVAAGPEPVIGYVMARRAEVVMLRTLLIGKLSGVPTDALRRRLRERYE